MIRPRLSHEWTAFRLLFVLAAISASGAASAQSWTPQTSNTTVALRGISAVSPMVAWASGAKGTFLRTTDGGATWTPNVVPGAADADFRAVHAFSEKSVFLMSAGTGPLSRLYQTDDGGVKWNLVMVDPDPKGFWDGIAFWDRMHGILLGDPLNGRFEIWTTSDGGDTWKQQKGPQALEKEGTFAASNSSLIVRGAHDAWFATGGPDGARILHSEDDGKTWTAVKTPVRHDSDNAGIFSLAFSDARHGVAVGGDYSKPKEATSVIAITSDGGKSWTAPASSPSGYRSAVAYVEPEKLWIASGPSGSDVSLDDGKTWKSFDTGNYNAIGFVGSSGWAVGQKGVIASFHAR